MNILHVIFYLAVIALLPAPTFAQNPPAARKHPNWIAQGNIYEVNLRQYTRQGTLKAFARHLPRLQRMGVQTLWFMPINPISKKDRKGTLGSYYAVASYTEVNPEFGTLNDFKAVVQEAHRRGMKVIIDWVPNHTGADHPWLVTHPDFYQKDSTGVAATMFDWTDTRVLNFKNPVMEDSMIRAMRYWLTETHIDGFRVDVAWNVPGSFWQKCIPQLHAVRRNLFMLAEGEDAYLHQTGFHATYPWKLFHHMEKIAAGERPAFALDSALNYYDTAYPAGSIKMYFTSNHDENSWNRADYGTFPGRVHTPFAVLSQTLAGSVPLIYSGQEEPVLRPLSFFEKDTIHFRNFKRASFYRTLLQLRRTNPALSAFASFEKVSAGNPEAVYAFVRRQGKSKVLVITNLSNTPQTIQVHHKNVQGGYTDVFTQKQVMLGSAPFTLEPWGYRVWQ